MWIVPIDGVLLQRRTIFGEVALGSVIRPVAS
jgi:hypothetical protein